MSRPRSSPCCFNAGLGFVQKSRAQATLDALKSRVALVAPVRRTGTGLAQLGVLTIMITGDARATAEVVAREVGISGEVWAGAALPETLPADACAVFAGMLLEEKYHLAGAFQQGGLVVGMCGDGANDAPALRQAHMGCWDCLQEHLFRMETAPGSGVAAGVPDIEEMAHALDQALDRARLDDMAFR